MARTGKRGRKGLRSGFSTGACAAAAAKAAVEFLCTGEPPVAVEIPFPAGSRHGFAVHRACRVCGTGGGRRFRAAVRKDAGDDPDVTNGAEIVATVWRAAAPPEGGIAWAAGRLALLGGEGVGRVTRPGLAVAVGEPAINPVPRRMIRQAVAEALAAHDPGPADRSWLVVEISVPGGEELAARTLNRRLGIVGGLSILGTTGIVHPVSAAAWKATITASMDVARAAGLAEIVLATGRTSERAVFAELDLPEEAGVMMGDYLEFSLREAGRRRFSRLHLAGMWAKVLKAAMEIPQTHVRHGALDTGRAAAFLCRLARESGLPAAGLDDTLAGANTAREIYGRLLAAGRGDLVRAVCGRARLYAERVSGLPVRLYLVDAAAKVRVRAG